MDKRTYFKLTEPQKRIWYVEKISGSTPINNIGGCLRISNSMNIDYIKKSISKIIELNEGLRIRIIDDGYNPRQYIKTFEQQDIDFFDFSNFIQPKVEQEKWAKENFNIPFNLEDSNLYYFAIYKLSEEEYGIFLKIHHIISDGWSIALLQKQFCQIYETFMLGEEIQIQKSSYIDYIDYEKFYFNSNRFLKNRNFWLHRFSGDMNAFLYMSSNTLDGKRKSVKLSRDLSCKISNYCNAFGFSLNTFFVTIMLIYIYKTYYKDEIILGIPVYNRINEIHREIIGMFTSTLPLKFKFTDNYINIEKLFNLVNRELRISLVNQQYPYNYIIKDLNIESKHADSIFKFCVNYYNTDIIHSIGTNYVELDEFYSGYQNYALQLTIKEWEKNNITLNFDYKLCEFSDEEIVAMQSILIYVCEQIVLEHKSLLSDILIMSPNDFTNKIIEFNDTQQDFPKKTVYQLFEEQVKINPNKIAIEHDNSSITYRELNERSNQLARYLIQNGINQTSVVAIMETHSIDLIISILAVLKTRAAYLPVDPNYPIERKRYIIDDSRCNMILTNYFITNTDVYNVPIIDVRVVNLSEYFRSDLYLNPSLEDLAYIMYTSASTGKPKGVMVEHLGLTNYIFWAFKVYFDSDDEVMPLYSSISFDLTITSIFTPLISGNKIIVYDKDETEFVLYKILRENKITILKLTPAHLSLLKDVDNRLSNLKKLIVGGESLKVKLAKDVYYSFDKNIEIYNEYGPTETIVGCMIHKYDEQKDIDATVPIGTPIDNVQIYVLDEKLNPCQSGVIGDLYISGICVSKGYRSNLLLNKKNFIQNPFIDNQIMYKSGDKARFLTNNTIEYIGREDSQIKIRGYRIDLKEIEYYLLNNENIDDAIVLHEEVSDTNKYLIAYVKTIGNLTDNDIKGWLLKYLPDYMLPSKFVLLDKFPLSQNGKIDYFALKSLVKDERNTDITHTPLDNELLNIISQVLEVEQIRMSDNFFYLGGDSIKAIQISSIAKKKGIEIKIGDILSSDSIEEIIMNATIPDIIKNLNQLECEGMIENTPIINWFFKQNFQNNNYYNQNIIIKINKKLDKEVVSEAIKKLITHHDMLRVNYDKGKHKLFYNNFSNHSEVFKYYCFNQSDGFNLDKIIYDVNNNMDIEKKSLFHCCLVDYDKWESHYLVFIAHHLIVDGVSWRIILEDFFNIILQLQNGEKVVLPLKTSSYQSWANALNDYSKKTINENISFSEQFNNSPKFIKELQVKEENMALCLHDEIDGIFLSELIKKTNDIFGLTLYEVLVISFVISLSKLLNTTKVIIELEQHGREFVSNEIDVTRTVGWFTSLFSAEFEICNHTLKDNIKSLKEQFRDIQRNSFKKSLEYSLNTELMSKVANPFVRFNYLGDFDSLLNNNILDILDVKFDLQSDKENKLTTAIDFTLIKMNQVLKINVKYNKMIFQDDCIQEMINTYKDTLVKVFSICQGMSEKVLTPSDFKDIEMKQDDLDLLFN